MRTQGKIAYWNEDKGYGFIQPETSIITFIIYAKDKSAARQGHWRTKESTLHMLALLGGWPGALIAQQTLRHKSQKADFRFVFWVTVVLNCGIYLWLFTLSGSVISQMVVDGVKELLGNW